MRASARVPGSLERMTAAVSEDIEVVVGRIGKPHGLRGEVTVDVRTDEPERRFAAGTALRAEAPAGSATAARARSRSPRSRWHQSVLLVRFEELGRPQRRRGGPRHRAARHPRPADDVPEDPEEFYDHQLVGLAAYDIDGAPLGEVTARRPRRAPRTCSPIRTPDGRDALVPFVAALVPEVDLRRRPGRRRRPARPGHAVPDDEDRAASDREDRRRLDLPRLPRPARALACRARPATRACSTCTSTTCATGRTTGTAPSTTRRTAAAPAW